MTEDEKEFTEALRVLFERIESLIQQYKTRRAAIGAGSATLNDAEDWLNEFAPVGPSIWDILSQRVRLMWQAQNELKDAAAEYCKNSDQGTVVIP